MSSSVNFEEESLLSEAEELLKKRFNHSSANKKHQFPSQIPEAQQSERVEQLVLPDSMRANMPITKEKFLVKENPHLVQWERETRKFLRNLSPAHGHRVAAVMIYEWATGIEIAALVKEGGSANSDLRKINQILRGYFGKPYMTYICGRKVPKAYRVPPGYYIKKHRPITLTLYAEYSMGTLNP